MGITVTSTAADPVAVYDAVVVVTTTDIVMDCGTVFDTTSKAVVLIVIDNELGNAMAVPPFWVHTSVFLRQDHSTV